MRRGHVVLAAVLFAGGGAPAARAADDASLAQAVAAAVDAPTAKARAAAAVALAARADASLEDWLSALPKFLPTVTYGVGEGEEEVAAPDGTKQKTPWYVPKSVERGKPAPLMLALHGTEMDGRDERERWRATADAIGMVVVAPTAVVRDEGYGFTAAERAAALSALRWARRRFDVDENRIFVSGVSRGGHMTWDLGSRNPGTFAALVPIIGAPRLALQHGQNNLRFVENLSTTPIRDLQGALDDARAVSNVRLAFTRLEAAGATDAKLLEFSTRGHDFDFSAVDWAAFFRSARRDPRPERVVRRASNAAESRAWWLEVLETTPGAVSDEVAPKQPVGWDKMSEESKRAYVQAEVDRLTARLEVTRTGPGAFKATSAGVKRFRVLLDRSMFEPGKPVTVVWNGRTITRAVTPSKQVLLADFVERFDRTFLPIAEFVVY